VLSDFDAVLFDRATLDSAPPYGRTPGHRITCRVVSSVPHHILRVMDGFHDLADFLRKLLWVNSKQQLSLLSS